MARSARNGIMPSTSQTTILEAAGLPEPKIVNGTPQTPIQGVSMLYAVENPKARRATDGLFRDLRRPHPLSRRKLPAALSRSMEKSGADQLSALELVYHAHLICLSSLPSGFT